MKQGTLFATTIIGLLLLTLAIIASFLYLEQKIQNSNAVHLAATIKLNANIKALDASMTEKLQATQKEFNIPNNLTVIWHKLDPIIASIELLPLKTRLQVHNKKPQENNSKTWQQRANATWQDLKNLVKIEQTATKDNPRLQHLRQLYKREQLRLHLEQVRLGAMYNNLEIYHDAINNAINLIQQNFDNDNSRVNSNIKELQFLLKVPLSVP